MKLDAGLLLQMADDAEEIVCLRIAARTEHTDETFPWRAGRRAHGHDRVQTRKGGVSDRATGAAFGPPFLLVAVFCVLSIDIANV
jgi:hypothetical protein